ncbi:MAG: hypothetical protein IJK28_11555 [Clostridia bacterium]|nr:hypothetical protein [Clostridia bacterium]
MKKLRRFVCALLALCAAMTLCASSLAEEAADPKPGDVIVFGTYNQDDINSNGREPIEWLVLDVRDGKALLLSVLGLDMQFFDPSEKETDWERCGLRGWLNKTFAEKAFTKEQLAAIPVTEVDNGRGKHIPTSTSDDPTTYDRLFLLSFMEAAEYLPNRDARRCVPTPHTKARGVVMQEDGLEENEWTCCWWWLRSPGSDHTFAAFVYASGQLSDNRALNVAPMAVRPACWLDLDAWRALND